MKSILILLSNDVSTDQRVTKVAHTLTFMGFKVKVIGRVLPNSMEVAQGLPYVIKRKLFFFNKGAMFYAELNIRWFWTVLFSKSDIIHSNDLDTLPAAYYASKLTNKKLVYDSHEYFTGVPELRENPIAYKVWKFFEKRILPKLENCFTVNQSIADLYYSEYNVSFKVLRNLPAKINLNAFSKSKVELGIPLNKKVLILQGAGINIGRGAEELLESLIHIKSDVFLLIIGSGDVWNHLLTISENHNLKDKVKFISKIPYMEMMNYTFWADLGFSLDKNNSINYKLSLPNKIFDYIMVNTPVVVSPLIEPQAIVEKFDVGYVLEEVSPIAIANLVDKIFANMDDWELKKSNCNLAREILNWENESRVLKTVYERV